jgi:hypothetical protein
MNTFHEAFFRLSDSLNSVRLPALAGTDQVPVAEGIVNFGNGRPVFFSFAAWRGRELWRGLLNCFHFKFDGGGFLLLTFIVLFIPISFTQVSSDIPERFGVSEYSILLCRKR